MKTATRTRTLAWLLTLCIALALLPTTAFAAAPPVTLMVDSNAPDDSAPRADGAAYATLMGAVNKAENGDTIKLSGNFVESKATDNTISNKTLTIDFNGFSYTSIYNVNVPYAIAAYTGSRVTITDSSIGHTGKLIIAKNSDGKCNDYALYCGGNSDGDDSGDGGVYVGEVSDLLGELETDQAGRMYIDRAKVEVPTDMQQVEAICSCGTRGAVFINDTFTTNGMVCSSSSAVVWVAMDAIDKLECYGVEGMVAVPLAEDMTLSNDLDLGVCRLLVIRGKTVTLNMNGHNITGKYGNIYVNPTSNLTIKNSDVVKSTMTNSISVHPIYGTCNKVVQWYNKAEPNIENHGTLTVEDNVYIKNDGTATQIIPSKSTKTYPYGIYQIAKMNDDAMLTVNAGAEIYAAGGAIVSNDEWYVTDANKIHTSTVTINGGSFRASNDAVSIPAGSLNVKNATLEGNYGIWIGTDNKMMEKLGSLDNVDFSVTQAYSTGIAISSSTQSSAGAGEPYSLHDIRINKSATAVPTAFLNETSGDIQLSGKNTYINCISLYSLTQGYPGAPTGTGDLVITGGIYSVDPSAYVPDSDSNGVKDYAILTLSSSPLRYLVAPWTEVGADSTVSLYYTAAATDDTMAADTVDIDAIDDTEFVITDPEFVQAKQFTLSSSDTAFDAISGLNVVGFSGTALTVQKAKGTVVPNGTAYVWYGDRSVGAISFDVTNEPTFTVDGGVKDDGDSPVENAVVTLTQGSTVKYGPVYTDAKGNFAFSGVVPGIYDLVAKKTDNGVTHTVTSIITVTDSSLSQSLVLHSEKRSSILEVAVDTPDVVVGKLNTIADDYEFGTASADNTVKVTLTVAKEEESTQKTDHSAIRAAAEQGGGTASILFLDATLTREVNGAPAEDIGADNETVLELVIPYDFTDKENVQVYRRHGGDTTRFTQLPSRPEDSFRDGECYLDIENNRIFVYAKRFSTYAITYTTPGSPILPVPSYTLKFASNGGTVYANESYPYGKTVTLGKTPSREGYTFTGWYSDAALTSAVTEVKITDSRTVYAGWSLSPIPAMLNGSDHFAYVTGYEDGTVRPANSITRAEVAVIFYRLLNDDVRAEHRTSSNSFSDVTDDMWCNTAISTMAALGIVDGRGSGIFDPNAPISRAEFAAICARFDTEALSLSSSFTDISGHWAEAQIQRAAVRGWVKGYEDGSFRPEEGITRAEAMALINSVLRRFPQSVSDLLPGMNIWPDNADSSAWYYLAVQEASNSHGYVMTGDGVHETWSSLAVSPDWTAEER